MNDDEIIARAVALLEARIRNTEIISNNNDAKTYLRLKLGHLEREVFAVLLLDTKHRVLHYEEIFYGTIDRANVYPREIVKAALAKNAAAIILAHNHPSGVAEPSQTDLVITQRVKEAMGLIDVRVLDHIVVTRGTTVSMTERGLL